MPLHIHFFGCFTMAVQGRPVLLPLRGVTLELLCYLALHGGREIRRDKLGLLFWPDRPEASARNLLSTALWRIRKAIAALDGAALASNGATVSLRLGAGATSDAEALESALHTLDLDGLVAALGPDDPEFLEGIASDWAQIERERQFNRRIRALTLLLDRAVESQSPEAALDFARRILALDPFREGVQRQCMWLYVEAGQQAQALRQYARFEALLAAEMGLCPARETQALRDLIRADGGMTGAERLRQVISAETRGRHSVHAALALPAN